MNVIWTRHIDQAASARAWRTLGMYGGIPAAVLLVIAFAVGGPGAFLGVLILAGIVLALWAVWIYFSQLGKRANPTVSLDGTDLVWARKRVPSGEVVVWSTFQSEASLRGDDAESVDMGTIKFGLRDGTEVQFLWASLPDHELEGLKAAVAPHLSANWVPIENWAMPATTS